MLNAIEKIKKLGTYRDYIKSADFNEFSIKNLIYGWNYSGKTTLSRIFSSLENKLLLVKSELNRKITEYSNLIQETKTSVAEKIRQRLKIYPYTAFHIGNDIPGIKSLGSQLLAEKELSDAIELVLTSDSKKPTEVPKITAIPSINALYKETIEVMAATPTLSNTIKHLEDNPELESWIEDGLHLHPEPGSCEFCGNEINEQRLNILRSHFSKDFAAHKAKVRELLDRIKTAELKIEIPKSIELNAQFREAYDLACLPLPKQIEKFNQSIQKLILEITGKLENSRKSMKPSPVEANLAEDVVKIIESINTIIAENNQLALNFVSERKAALQKAKYHFVQEAANTLESNKWATKKTLLEKRVTKLDSFSSKLKYEISRLQAQISQAQQGRGEC